MLCENFLSLSSPLGSHLSHFPQGVTMSSPGVYFIVANRRETRGTVKNLATWEVYIPKLVQLLFLHKNVVWICVFSNFLYKVFQLSEKLYWKAFVNHATWILIIIQMDKLPCYYKNPWDSLNHFQSWKQYLTLIFKAVIKARVICINYCLWK